MINLIGLIEILTNMQVISGENYQELIEKGRVAEYKPPEAEKPVEPVVEAKADMPAVTEPAEIVDKSKKEEDKQATDAMSEDDEAGEDLPEKVRKTIGKKHRAMKEAEEFAEQQYNERKAAERRADNLFKELEEFKSKSRPDQPVEAKKPPNPEDFKTVAEYADALADFKVDAKFAERDRQAAEQRQKDEVAQVRAKLNERIAQTAKDIPDYEEVMSKSDIDVPGHVAQYIAESELGPTIGYHFAKNKDDFNRIAKLSPIRAIAELGKLEAKLEQKSEPAPKQADKTPTLQVSRAPAPIEPLDGKDAPVQKDPAKMTFQELREYERQRARAQRR